MKSSGETFNLAEDCLRENAVNRPEHPALIFHRAHGEATVRELYTFAEMEARVLRAAGVLREIVEQPGERVLIRLESDANFAILFFAACAAGLVPVPTSPELTYREANFLVQDSRAALVVCARSLEPVSEGVNQIALDDFQTRVDQAAAADYAPTKRDDPAFLIYTSGTSGKPKGVLHAHRSVLGRIPMRAGWTDLGAGDRLLHAGRLNWTYTLGVGLMDPWAVGATGILYGGGPSDPTVWPRLMEAEKATIFAAVPGVYRRIMKYNDLHEFDLGSLRHGLTAGERLPGQIREAWQEATDTELHEALGMSEISTYVSTGPGISIRNGSPGKPQPGRRVAVLANETAEHAPRILPAGETGLLAVHRDDPGLMLGYWNRPEEAQATRRGEWFVGGDLAAQDEDGYVFFHGRADELMNASGYRVAPLEVDQVLMEHPLVAEAAVGEWNVESGLNIIAAFVVLRKMHAPFNPDEARRSIFAFAAERLARYKMPREIFFIPALPRNGNGKLQRKHLQPAEAP